MQSSNQSPGSGSRTLWVWTTLLLLVAVTTTTPGGQVQAAESPQQQPRDLSLLTRIEELLEELLERLNSLLNYVTPTTTDPSATSNAATTPDGGTTSDGVTTSDITTSDGTETTTPGITASDGTSTDIATSESTETTTSESTTSGATSTDTSTSESTETTTPESTTAGATSTDTSTSESTETTTPESITLGATSTDTSTSESTETTTPESTTLGATSTDTSTSESTETTTPESTTSGATSTDTSTSDSTETTTLESTSSGTTSTDTSTSESTETTTQDSEPADEEKNNPGTIYLTKRSLAISRKLLADDNGVCIPKEDNDHCHELIHVMETIDDVTGKLEEGEVSQDMVDQLVNATSEMDTILEHTEEIKFHDDIKDKILSTIEDVNNAKVKVQKDIDAQNNDSQTLVIVLGSVGGFIVVALVATLIFAYYKKRKGSIDDKQKLNTEYVPINSFKEDGHDNPNFYPEVVTAQRPAQPQEVKTYGTPSQPKRSQMQDNSTSGQNYYETPSYSMVDEADSQNVPQRTSYRGGYATETQGQQPTYSRPPADKVPRPNLHGNTNKQSPRPVSGANYDTDHRSPSRPTSKTAYDYERKPNRSGYESDVRVPRVAPKPQSSRPYSPPGRSYDEEVKDPYSLDARGNVKRLSGAPAGGLRRVDN